MNFNEIIKGAILGHVVGDAVGLPVEFYQREKLIDNPVTQMLSGGNHRMPKGTWSDDSSMMLCTLESIIEKGIIDFEDIMFHFSKWATEGYMTPYGKPFGLGRTTLKSISKFLKGDSASNCGCSSEKDNGNGSLMRIMPISLYNSTINIEGTVKDKIQNVNMCSSLTHSNNCSCMACGIYNFIFEELMNNQCIESIHNGLKKAKEYYSENEDYEKFERIFSSSFSKMVEEDIKSSGYVVDTLEAAVWCLMNSHSYRESILKAVNLGGDTDTIAAITGSLAGVLYGFSDIPEEWLSDLVMVDDIISVCNKYIEFVNKTENT